MDVRQIGHVVSRENVYLRKASVVACNDFPDLEEIRHSFRTQRARRSPYPISLLAVTHTSTKDPLGSSLLLDVRCATVGRATSPTPQTKESENVVRANGCRGASDYSGRSSRTRLSRHPHFGGNVASSAAR